MVSENFKYIFRHLIAILIIWVSASGLLAWNFTVNFIGPEQIRLVDFMSTFVGWQWIFLLVYAGFLTVKFITKRNILDLKLLVVTFVVLLSIIAPAAYVRNTRLHNREYEGGPSGPVFECLIWKNSHMSGEYWGHLWGVNMCTVMNIPAYTKYLDNGGERHFQANYQQYDYMRTLAAFVFAEVLFIVVLIHRAIILGIKKV